MKALLIVLPRAAGAGQQMVHVQHEEDHVRERGPGGGRPAADDATRRCAALLLCCAAPACLQSDALAPLARAQVCDFLNMFTRALSGYYGPAAGVRILLPAKKGGGVAGDADAVAAMHARVHLCTAFRQVIRDNGLHAAGLLMITPLERM